MVPKQLSAQGRQELKTHQWRVLLNIRLSGPFVVTKKILLGGLGRLSGPELSTQSAPWDFTGRLWSPGKKECKNGPDNGWAVQVRKFIKVRVHLEMWEQASSRERCARGLGLLSCITGVNSEVKQLLFGEKITLRARFLSFSPLLGQGFCPSLNWPG